MTTSTNYSFQKFEITLNLPNNKHKQQTSTTTTNISNNNKNNNKHIQLSFKLSYFLGRNLLSKLLDIPSEKKIIFFDKKNS